MKERPILFSGEMVRAILDGRKTQTRRVVKPQPNLLRWCPIQSGRYDGWDDEHGNPYPCPYGVPGDQLWVRETCLIHCKPRRLEPKGEVVYKADFPDEATAEPGWNPSIFMPRWASRIQLEITNIRVERVQNISIPDAVAEGIRVITDPECPEPDERYRVLWDTINAKRGYSWETNPWVWVIEFKRIDQKGA